MAKNYNNEEGHWITTKDGKHLFIKEDLVDKQEREINEQKNKTESFNKDFSADIKKVTGMDEDDPTKLETKVNRLYMLLRDMTDSGYESDDSELVSVRDTYAKLKNRLFDMAQGKGSNEPEGKPLSSPMWFTDQRKGIAYGYQKYKNGYFVEEYNQITEKSIIRRISKEEFEKGRGADHAKMKASDFTSSIADVRKMPENSLRDIQKKNEAYIDIINQMKKSGYQGSEDKDYNDVISEFSALAVREGDIKRGRTAQKSQVATIKKNLENTMSSNSEFTNLRNFSASRRGDNVVVTYDYDVIKNGKSVKAHVRTVIDKDGKIIKSMTT